MTEAEFTRNCLPVQLALSNIVRDGAKYRVSTVMLPFGMGCETMVFGEGSCDDLYCDRYETKDAALAGHEKAVREFWPGEKTAPAPVEF